MSRHRRLLAGIVAVLATAPAGFAAWGIRDTAVAKRCLDGELHPDGFDGAAIPTDACTITTTSDTTIRVGPDGPSLPMTLAAAGAALVFAVVRFRAIYRARHGA